MRHRRRLDFSGKLFWKLAGIAILAALVVIGILNAARSQAQSPAAASPKFEVASVRLCGDDVPAGRGGVGRSAGDPGMLRLGCQTLDTLIRQAYLSNGTPIISFRFLNQPIKGSPAWISSDRYTIEAKPEGTQTMGMMRGPMMRALLEDRFKLKIHRETREIPVYELTVAKGGPKLQVAQPGNCFILDRDHPLVPPEPGKREVPFCGGLSRVVNSGSASYAAWYGATMADLCHGLSIMLDRDAIDKTGLMGAFDIRLETSPADLYPEGVPAPRDPTAPPVATDPARGPSIFAAVQQQLGLKLVPAKGPGEYLVIDHVEKPSEN